MPLLALSAEVVAAEATDKDSFVKRVKITKSVRFHQNTYIGSLAFGITVVWEELCGRGPNSKLAVESSSKGLLTCERQ